MLDEAPVEIFGATGEGELDLRVQRQISRWRCGWAQPVRPASHNSSAWQAKAAETGLMKGRCSAFLRPNQYPPFTRVSPGSQSTAWKEASWVASHSAAGRSMGKTPSQSAYIRRRSNCAYTSERSNSGAISRRCRAHQSDAVAQGGGTARIGSAR